jgi:hypothetical protein
MKYRCFTVLLLPAAWLDFVLCCKSMKNRLVALDGFLEAGGIEQALKMADLTYGKTLVQAKNEGSVVIKSRWTAVRNTRNCTSHRNAFGYD